MRNCEIGISMKRSYVRYVLGSYTSRASTSAKMCLTRFERIPVRFPCGILAVGLFASPPRREPRVCGEAHVPPANAMADFFGRCAISRQRGIPSRVVTIMSGLPSACLMGSGRRLLVLAQTRAKGSSAHRSRMRGGNQNDRIFIRFSDGSADIGFR